MNLNILCLTRLHENYKIEEKYREKSVQLIKFNKQSRKLIVCESDQICIRIRIKCITVHHKYYINNYNNWNKIKLST